MTEEQRNRLGDYSVRFGLNEYFANSLLPMDIKGIERRVTRTTPRTQADSGIMMLVRSGKGKVSVNNRVFAVERGSFLCLGPFHSYSMIPDKGETLELSMCIMDCGVYTYIFSCPYIKVKEFVVPQPPASAKLDDTELEDALELMGNISSSEGDSYFNKKMRFLYALELTGIAMRKQMTGK